LIMFESITWVLPVIDVDKQWLAACEALVNGKYGKTRVHVYERDNSDCGITGGSMEEFAQNKHRRFGCRAPGGLALLLFLEPVPSREKPHKSAPIGGDHIRHQHRQPPPASFGRQRLLRNGISEAVNGERVPGSFTYRNTTYRCFKSRTVAIRIC
jgi:hypothetical protein